MKYFISIAIFMFISSFAGVRAQNDPTLAGMIIDVHQQGGEKN